MAQVQTTKASGEGTVEIDLHEAAKSYRLDTTDPANGEVHGGREGGVFYIDKDGFPFGQTGNLLIDAMDAGQKDKFRRKIATERAKTAAKETMAQALRAQGFSEDDISRIGSIELTSDVEKIAAKSKGVEAMTGEIDLEGWARGNRDYPFDKLQAAVVEKYGAKLTRPVDILDILSMRMKIPAAELRTDF